MYIQIIVMYHVYVIENVLYVSTPEYPRNVISPLEGVSKSFV